MTIPLLLSLVLTIDLLNGTNAFFLNASSLWRDPWFIGLVAAFVSLVANAEFYRRFGASIRSAPRLDAEKDDLSEGDLLKGEASVLPSVSVIVPAYNEAANIEDCLRAILKNRRPAADRLQAIVADDESTDETAALAQQVAKSDKRVTVFTVPPRPTEIAWRGKNWACMQAAKRATGEYLLFLDADVRLEEEAIARALFDAQAYDTDLLSCAPKIICGCFSEWLIQPIMATLIAVGFSFDGVNDPNQLDKAAAAGPFMLFRRRAYEQIGTHAAVATETVEDFALAKLIKSSGLTLRYVIGLDVASVRMYRSFGGLWEGWTKNFYIAAERSFFLTTASAVAVFLIFVVPWAGLVAGFVGVWNLALSAGGSSANRSATALLLVAGLAVLVQVYGRVKSARIVAQPPKYIWLGWLGGGIISAICLASMVKTETGWGWTWRGRSLAD